MRRRVVSEELAMWGVRNTFVSFRKSGCSAGSFSNTSRPAAAMVPRFSASMSAASSTTPPRAALIRIAVGFIFANSGAPIIWCVAGEYGTCSVRMSERDSSSSMLTYAAWQLFSTSADRRRVLWYSTVMSKPRARRATAWPMRPMPRMARESPEHILEHFARHRDSGPIHLATSRLLIKILRQPQADPWKRIKQEYGENLDAHERHHAGEDLGERHVRRRHALEIKRGHRHRRRQECRLQVERHQKAEKQRIDIEVRQQRNEDRHKNDDDLGPLERPAEQEDDDLRQDHELHRTHVERKHPLLDNLLAAEQRERRRENGGADEQPADHRTRLGGEERGILDDGPKFLGRAPDHGADMAAGPTRPPPMGNETVDHREH